jgi:hypothetical protein
MGQQIEDMTELARRVRMAAAVLDAAIPFPEPGTPQVAGEHKIALRELAWPAVLEEVLSGSYAFGSQDDQAAILRGELPGWPPALDYLEGS